MTPPARINTSNMLNRYFLVNHKAFQIIQTNRSAISLPHASLELQMTQAIHHDGYHLLAVTPSARFFNTVFLVLLTVDVLHRLPRGLLLLVVELQFLQLFGLLVLVDVAAVHVEVVVVYTGERGLEFGVVLVGDVEFEFLPRLEYGLVGLDAFHGFGLVEALDGVVALDFVEVVLLEESQP